MTNLIIKGMTRQQCEVFVEWYSNSGEQDADYTFENARLEYGKDTPTPYCDGGKTWPLSDEGDVVMWVGLNKTPINPVMLDGEIESIMFKVDGERFYCNCGGNVFHKPDDRDVELIECNSCGEHYRGD